MTLKLSLIISSLLLVGCATNATVSPSQNSSLQAVSPNTAAASQGGAMQRSLDAWLKDEWTPLTTPKAVQQTKDGADNKNVEVASATSKQEEEKAFTLQSFADKWKVYHENEAKLNEGKPKEASHVETLQKMPVIGK